MALSLRERMGASMTRLRENTQKTEQAGSSIYWKASTDDAGNGTAVIRFLPQKDLDAQAMVESWSFYFKNPRTGNTYSDQAARTFGRDIPDPVSQFNSYVWGLSEDKEATPQEREELQKNARTRAQKHQYYSNILVIKDPLNPENEGKVFVYRYGKKIYEKIHSQMYPKFEEDTPCVPFDMFAGKNFRLVVKQVADYPNYDDSNFSSDVGAIADTDDEIESILEQCHDLNALILDQKNLSTYDKKMENLKRTMGTDELFIEWMESIGEEVSAKPRAPTKSKKEKAVVEKTTKTTSADDGDGEDGEYESKPASKKTISSEVDQDVDDILSELGF